MARMTVAELIEGLKQFPLNAECWGWDDESVIVLTPDGDQGWVAAGEVHVPTPDRAPTGAIKNFDPDAEFGEDHANANGSMEDQ